MVQVQATAAGTAHAIIMWWKLNLDKSGHITLDTAPAWVNEPTNNAFLSTPVPGVSHNAACGSLEQAACGRRGMQTRSEQPDQQWRDHWKQCWTPVQPHELGEVLA